MRYEAPGEPMPGPQADPADKGGEEGPLPRRNPELNQPPALVSAATAASPVEGDVVCPTCGTRNPKTARFCKKDGVPLRGSAPTAASPRTPPRPPKGWRRLPVETDRRGQWSGAVRHYCAHRRRALLDRVYW